MVFTCVCPSLVLHVISEISNTGSLQVLQRTGYSRCISKDAFWTQAGGGNPPQLRTIYCISIEMLSSVKTLERAPSYPSFGSRPVKDLLGMGLGSGHVNAELRPREAQRIHAIRHLQDISIHLSLQSVIFPQR